MKFLAIVIKDLRLFFRDRAAIFWAFILPVIFITVFGLAFSGGGSKTRLLVVQQDSNPAAEAYVSMLGDVLEIEKIDSYSDAEHQVREGKVAAMMVIPEGFSEKEAPAQLIYDELQMIKAGEIKAIVEAVTLRFYGESPPIVERSVRGKQYNSFQFYVPGMGILFLLMVGGIGGIMRILNERVQGTLRRNLLTPVGRASFLGGQLLIGFLIGCMQLALYFSIGVFVFGMAVEGSPLLVALIGILVVWLGVGIGLFLSPFAPSPDAASGATMAIVLPMCALGGLWFPLEIMPQWMQSFARVLPTTHAMNAFQDVIIRGKDLFAIAPSLLVLAGFAFFFLAAGLILFRWKE